MWRNIRRPSISADDFGRIFILLAVADAKLWAESRGFSRFMAGFAVFLYSASFRDSFGGGLLGYLTHQPVSWLFHGGFFLNYAPDGQPYDMGWRWCADVVWDCRAALLPLCVVCEGQEGASGFAVAVLVSVLRLLVCLDLEAGNDIWPLSFYRRRIRTSCFDV